MKRLKVEHFGTKTQGVRLEGNPQDPEPDYFVVKLPGGHVEISRTSDGSYWIHFTTNRADDCLGSDLVAGRLVDSRIDCEGKSAHEVIGGDFARDDTYHVAVRLAVRHDS